MNSAHKPLKRFFDIFTLNQLNSYFWLTGILLLMQQIVVASSSVWLTRFSKNLQSGSFDTLNLFLFSFSLIFPYLPGALSLSALKKWEIACQNSFWETYIVLWRNRIDLWSHKNRKNKQTSLVSKDGPQLISETNRYFYDLTSSSLNVLLNLITISSLLDTKLIFSFILGTFLLIFCSMRTKNKNQKIAAEFEKEKLNLNSWLSIVWDNLTIGNTTNLFHWRASFDERKLSLNKKTMEFCYAQEVTSTLISMLGFLPTISFIIFYCYENSARPQDLVPFVVLFPRIFILLNMTTSLVYLLRSSYGYVGRWTHFLDQSNHQEQEDLVKRINMNKITIDQLNKSFETPNDFLFAVANKNQRLTLRGENGAGKSTLLHWLKNEIGSDSYYLPHENNLVFKQVDEQKSTGQKMRSQLNEILKKSEVSIILLDEWDANMDAKNIAETSRQIDEISQYKTIIEVRHR